MRTKFLAALWLLPLFGPLATMLSAGVPVYVRDSAGGPVKTVVNAVNGPGGTIRVTIPNHGFSENDRINVDGVGGCYRASGTRTVVAVVDGNTVDLKGRDGQPLDCGGTFRPAHSSGTLGARYYTAAKLTKYTLNDAPNVYGLDGPSGTVTLALQTRAKAGNPAYDAMKAIADAALGSGSTPYTASTTPANRGAVFSAAMMWHAHGRSTCSGGTITTRANGSKFCTTDPTWEYFDMARWWINHAEDIMRGPGCDESITNCGRSGYQNSIDQNSPELTSYPTSFSLIYERLTDSERTAFSSKMLNNVKLNNSSETSCTNQYVEQTGSTLSGTLGNKFVTISPAAAAGNVTIGSLLKWNASSPNSPISDRSYVVAAVNTSTGRIELTTAIGDASPSSTSWYTVTPWDSSIHCGFVWFEAHFDINTLWTRDAYPPAGGNSYSWQSNLAWWRNDAYMAIGASTCPHDVRGCELFERAQAFYYDQMSIHAKNLWTGFTQAGSGSYQGRVQGNAGMSASTLKGAVTPSLDTSGGLWLKRTLLRQIYDNLPGESNRNHFHSWGETAQRSINAYGLNHFQYLIGAAGATEEADRSRHWLFNRFPYAKADLQYGGGIFAPWSFLNVDPNATRSDYTALSPQYLFQQTDLDTPPQNYLGAYSKTGWGNSDTSILMLAGGSWEDHWQWRSPGTYQIFNGNYLYADDRGASIGACGSSASCFSAENENSSSILIGEPSSATATQQYSWMDGKFDPIGPKQGSYIESKRWAGTNPTGRADNKFTYFAYDAYRAANTATVGATVQRAWHHYLHLKSNGRDYLLRYVDIGASAPTKIRGFLHFPNNEGPTKGEGYTSMDEAGTIYTTTNQGTSMHTRVLVPANGDITDFSVRRTSASVLTFNSDATASNPVHHNRGGLRCIFTSPATVTLSSGTGLAYMSIDPQCNIVVGHNGLALSNSPGVQVRSGITAYPAGSDPIMVWASTATGWAGQGYIKGGLPNSGPNNRRFVADLGTNTSADYLVLHQINKDQVTKPIPYTVLDSGADWRSVQLESENPVVVAFSRAGCKASWNAATNHAGTADVVIAGLCPGTYDLTRNGATVCSAYTVTTGDETLYCASASGNLSIFPVGSSPTKTTSLPSSTPTIDPALPPSGRVGNSYTHRFTVVGGTAPYAWSLASGTPPVGLRLEVDGNLSGTPSSTSTSTFKVAVKDATNQPVTATFTVTILPPALAIRDQQLPEAWIGGSYKYQFLAEGGTLPYQWSLTSGALPTGLTLQADGTVIGIPTTAVPSTFTVVVTDAEKTTANRTFTINAKIGATSFYVSPTGSAAGDGSQARPWDLRTALSQPAAVRPGDTIWLRGGVYAGPFESKLLGTAGTPITVRQYPGEKSVLDGHVATAEASLNIRGAWTWFWGIEVTNSTFKSVLTASEASATGPCVLVSGSDNALINLTVHDCRIGIQDDDTNARNTMVYGSLVYNVGQQTTNGVLGSALLSQNTGESKYIWNNIFATVIGENITVLGAQQGAAQSYRFDANIVANGPVAIAGGGVSSIEFTNNHVYRAPVTLGKQKQLNGSLSVSNNYLTRGLSLVEWSSAKVEGNKVFSRQATTGPLVALNIGTGALGAYQINYNSYSIETTPGRDFSVKTSDADQPLTFDEWSTRGFDREGNYKVEGVPSPEVVVLPNIFESERAHVIAYNWGKAASITADLSRAGFKVGQRYRLSNAALPTNSLVVTYDGGPITIPMTAADNQPAVEFGIFLVAADTATEVTSIEITPSTVTVEPGRSQQFSATVKGTSNDAVTWSVSPQTGSITSTGLYTAPAELTDTTKVEVRATSTQDPSKWATAQLSIQPATLQQVASPVYSPNGGTFNSAQIVTISSSTTGAVIRYTTDGSTPSPTTGVVYSAPITIDKATTVKAVAYKTGMTDSAVVTANFEVILAVAPPVFSPAGGTFSSAQIVTISSSTTGAVIRYTTDGSTPSPTTGVVYSAPITVENTTTVKAVAYKTGMTDSAVVTAHFDVILAVAPPVFSPAGGTYTSAQVVTLSAPTTGAVIRYTVDGSTPSAATGLLYSAPITISKTTTVKALAYKNGMTDSAVVTANFEVMLPVAPPVFSPAGGTYTSAQVVTLSTPTTGAVIRYTVDGSTPSVSKGLLYKFPITIGKTTTVKAVAYKTGMSDSAVRVAAYVITGPTAPTIHSFTPSQILNGPGRWTGQFKDANGVSTIATTELRFGGEDSEICWIRVNHQNKSFEGWNSTQRYSGALPRNWGPSTPLGQQSTVGRCSYSATASATSDALTTSFALNYIFPPNGPFSFSGPVYIRVTDTGGLTSNWVKVGHWEREP